MPGEVAALIAATSAAPKGRTSPSWPPAVPPAWSTPPIRFMAISSSACTGSPLRSLSEASIPPIAFSRHCSNRKISTPQLARQKFHRLATQKPQNDLTLARHRPSLAQVPAGRPAKPGLGKTWMSQTRPRLPTDPSTATFFSKLSVMFRSSLDTLIKPILCPRKSGPTHMDHHKTGDGTRVRTH